MRKMVFGRHLSRSRKGRIALFRSLIRALTISGKIVTTRAKAKALIPQIDKIVTAAKKNSVSARRRVLAELGNDRATTDLIFVKIVPAFSNRNSGFTRIVLLPARRGDKAQMVRLEWSETIEMKESPKKETKEKEKKAVKKAEKPKKEKPLKKK
ncbi:MAG: 50S ribosomal protein L17 [Candidatus Woesebacteria bacterium GW2011_GWD1_47_21]|uniref:50S ribosomal protein L17 n=8 Tax=Candidatus Woeseibacteriota TaxID=1752722 RepID=A0A0G1UVD3_9BACT|nr:MAG: 50S ribosomal protein L17 [Candidatus Woesebacteria bacterium GW2011_GWF1_46_13]KKU70023.1 MAG: 50S ribosomal protein L17 [Candidatus Woesebacteria bacterium GW2011_GWD1_47_21]OGM83189.1 MAG: 50S ribosomal protein L17 [Candidatus Woesebacteria bacterium RIFOXYB1_FULL_47_31]OGM86734.1 MAG: 50S ribosomal protein L17 [Candidatus Woesebacteria bacterium RIFOXYC1_FULL_46_16]OGM89049.1 MAG: 50S ribosomal protein L17 [Candidatus Woesebacteria bacterium RIFOXYD1_FULL_46_19]